MMHRLRLERDAIEHAERELRGGSCPTRLIARRRRYNNRLALLRAGEVLYEEDDDEDYEEYVRMDAWFRDGRREPYIDSRRRREVYPLYFAIRFARFSDPETGREPENTMELINELLADYHRVDPNATSMWDNEPKLPLHEAVRRGELGIVRALLERGANPNMEELREGFEYEYMKEEAFKATPIEDVLRDLEEQTALDIALKSLLNGLGFYRTHALNPEDEAEVFDANNPFRDLNNLTDETNLDSLELLELGLGTVVHVGGLGIRMERGWPVTGLSEAQENKNNVYRDIANLLIYHGGKQGQWPLQLGEHPAVEPIMVGNDFDDIEGEEINTHQMLNACSYSKLLPPKALELLGVSPERRGWTDAWRLTGPSSLGEAVGLSRAPPQESSQERRPVAVFPTSRARNVMQQFSSVPGMGDYYGVPSIISEFAYGEHPTNRGKALERRHTDK